MLTENIKKNEIEREVNQAHDMGRFGLMGKVFTSGRIWRIFISDHQPTKQQLREKR
jgi:hypothetical protein